jgi:autotransporter-associated beta strand protein
LTTAGAVTADVTTAGSTFTLAGAVATSGGSLVKIGEGTLELKSPVASNVIGSSLDIYGGGISLGSSSGSATQYDVNGVLNIALPVPLGTDGTSGSLTLSGDAVLNVTGHSAFAQYGGTAALTLNDNAIFKGTSGRIGGQFQNGMTLAYNAVSIELNNNSQIQFSSFLNLSESFSVTDVTMNGTSAITAASSDLGWGERGTCTMVMNGSTSFTTSGSLNIARSGAGATASLTMVDNATVTTGRLLLAYAGIDGDRAIANLTMSGDTSMTVNGEVDFGYNLGDATVTLSDNAQIVATGSVAIANDSNASATVTMSGNSLLSSGDWLAVGNVFDGWNVGGNGAGEVFMSDTSRIVAADHLEVAYGGTGILHIGDGTATDNAVVSSMVNPVILGWGTIEAAIGVPTNARIDINAGGTLEAIGIITGSDDPGTDDFQSAVVNFNGGTLKALAANTDFVANLGGATVFGLNVQAGGATINTNGYDVTINTALAEDPASTGGGLTKKDAGRLTLTGDNTYSGDTIVQGGTLSIDAAMLDDDADLSIALGAVMDLNFAATDTIDALFFNGASQALGTWGSTASGATHISDLYFTGLGMVLVTDFPVTVHIPGDTNDDLIVDATDAAKLALNWGNTVSSGDYHNGDFNGDGLVNAADASILAANWGNHAGEGNGAVPEPGTLALLIGLALAMVVRRTRRS